MSKISRDEKGAVQCDFGTFTVPQNRSMLSYFGNPTNVYDGDDFASDPHWVTNTKTGKRRKQLRNGASFESKEVFVWTRRLEQDYIPELEKRYFRVLSTLRPRAAEMIQKVIADIMAVGGKVHCVPSNSEQNGGKIWLYDVRYDPYYKCNTYAFKWVDRPESLIHLDLGNALYKADKRSQTLWSRILRFEDVLKRLLEEKICEMISANRRLCEKGCWLFSINDRDYCMEKYGSREHTSFRMTVPEKIVIE